ncbi:MAG: SH3 domain-containing protein [Oscillospiraceae bacterium]|jgi:D-alanyl-D-alanine dipeptidase|nr:SH3 domain-containing protein [Oscillospiraceae bacterium]
MKVVKSLSIVLLIVFILSACTQEENTPEQTTPPDSNQQDLGSDEFSGEEAIPTEPPDLSEPIVLLRDENGILIGSMVFPEPVLRVGHFREAETENNVINVRSGPSLDSPISGQINYRRVVEATEVVNGWYNVTVLSNERSNIITGYIRSDLLREYSEEGSHNHTQLGSEMYSEPVKLVGALSIANVREGPNGVYDVVATIGRGQLAEATELVDGWYKVTVFPGMFVGYIDSSFLVEHLESRKFFAEPRIDSINVRQSSGEVITRESKLVDVRELIPDIEVYLIFATPDNFTGRTLYDRDIFLLQEGTARKLLRAQELFKQDGYRIKVYDAYRPSSVSGILFDIIRDPNYVARAGTSSHNRAAAVDITLIDEFGNELEMPSPMHTFNSTSHRDSSAMSAEAKKNMDYMASIMRQSGFTTIQTEWWHFSDSDSSRYPPLDFSFKDFTFRFVDDYNERGA